MISSPSTCIADVSEGVPSAPSPHTRANFIVSRSKESILKEVKAITELPDFKGYLSDLGGPSANMYRMKGRDEAVCRKCKRPSCIYPRYAQPEYGHRPLLDIYHAVDALPGIKKSFIGSGVRYDLLLHQSKDPNTNKSTQEYTASSLPAMSAVA